jgi:hypothetical protein
LIYKRQDVAAIEPLRKLRSPATAPLSQSRVNALWSLEGLHALRDEDLVLALSDKAPDVRAEAIKLLAKRVSRSLLLSSKVLTLADDPDVRVWFLTAFALGEISDPKAATALGRLAIKDGALTTGFRLQSSARVPQ